MVASEHQLDKDFIRMSKEIHGVDLLHFGEDGRIKEFTVMVRPQSAVHALGEAVLRSESLDGVRD